MEKWSAHSFEDLGAAIARLNAGASLDGVGDGEQLLPSVLLDLGDAFAALSRVVGEAGSFHVIMQIPDAARFRELGPHREATIEVGNGEEKYGIRSVDLKGARLTAFCRLAR